MTTRDLPRRWDIADKPPPNVTVLVNGVPASLVRRYDCDRGFVVVLCTRGDLPGHLDKPHLDPYRPDFACETILHGDVEVVPREAVAS